MKNREKFTKEILDITCRGIHVAVCMVTQKPRECIGMSCKKCYLYKTNYPGHKNTSCRENFVHWANAEYKEKKEFSEADKAFVRGVDKLNWFARDRNGVVYGYVDKPFKNSNVWWDVKVEVGDEYAVERVSSYTSATFEPLSWDDEEPTSREEIFGK